MRVWTVSSYVLSRKILEICDLSLQGVNDGYFNGIRSWRENTISLAEAERTKIDKLYYITAEYLKSSRSPLYGCSVADFSRWVLAYTWLTYKQPASLKMLPIICWTCRLEDSRG